MLTEAQWREFTMFGRLIEAQEYRFANTMAQDPHSYTLRKTWQSENDFIWTVDYIRRAGYRQKYGGRWYIKMDVNGHSYWTMGDAISSTILINRASTSLQVPYDQIAAVYPTLFTDKASHAENKMVFKFVGDVSRADVLDVGCGIGLFLQYAEPCEYLGIDPSQQMLCQMCRRWPHARTVCTPLRSFVGAPFDVVCGLFGVGSYLSTDEVLRVPSLLRSGGLAVMMFYRRGYTPVTYECSNCSVPFNDHYDVLDVAFPGHEKVEIDGHVLIHWRKP